MRFTKDSIQLYYSTTVESQHDIQILSVLGNGALNRGVFRRGLFFAFKCKDKQPAFYRQPKQGRAGAFPAEANRGCR